VVRDGVQIDHRSYDGAGRVTQTGSGNLPTDYAAKLNEGLPQDQTNGLEVRLSQYDANGRLVHQRTLKSDGALKADINYDSYDAAGNVLQYSLTDQDGGYTNTYTYGLQRFEGYKQGTVSGTSTKMDPGTTTSSYDVNGNLVGITDSTKWQNNRTFVNDVSGHVLMVNQGGNAVRELVVNGEVIGQHGVGINPVTPRDGNGNPNFSYTADFDFGYQPIVANYPNAAPGSYTVQNGDTLQSIARSAYGDSALWFRIAEANGLSSDRDLRVGQTLNIPNQATGVHNDGSVFKPYDPSKVVGDTTPNLPMPSDGGGGCGVVGSIITMVVVIVVAYFTQQYYLVNYGTVAAGGGATAAGAGTAAAGTAAGAGGAAVGSAVTYTAGSMAVAGAIGGVAGAVAGQLVGTALGMQNGFDWRAVALGGIGGAVAGGLSSVNFVGNAVGNAAVRGVLTSAVTQGIGVATGLQQSFNWRSVAAAGMGAAAGAAMGQALGTALGTDNLGKFATAALTSAAAGTATAVARGGRVDVATIATDAFGNALGSSLAQANSAPASQAWDGTYLDKTPVKGIFLDTGGSANTVAYTSPDPILLASAGGIMSDAASPQEEAMMRMQGRQMEPWGSNPVYQNADGENIAANPLPATTVRATPIPALLDAETYTPGAYDYTDGGRKLLSGQFAEPGNGLGGLWDRQVQEFAGTVQGVVQTVAGAVRLVNDQGWVAANALTGGWLANNNADAAAAVRRNTALGQAIEAAPGAIASFGLRAAMANVSLDEVGQAISTAWQSDRIDQLKAAGDFAGAQAIRTQNVLGIASLAVGGEGLIASAAEVGGSLGRTAAMGTRLAAEQFADSRTAQIAGAMIEKRLYQTGAGPVYMMPPDFTIAASEGVGLSADGVSANGGTTYAQRLAQTPVSNGYWTGPRGESIFISSHPDVVPILGNKGIAYSNAYPDFFPTAAAQVEIPNMGVSRTSNFAQADAALAKQYGWSPSDVKEWRFQNDYTWHEVQDLKTMQLVPTQVNAKFGHVGGVGEINAGMTKPGG